MERSLRDRSDQVLARITDILKSKDLKGRFARGGIILSAGSACDIGFRFVRSIILTRLLAPDCFGLMANILSAVALFEAFTEVGARQAVIQNKRGGSDAFLNVAWWFSAVRGVALYGVAFFFAPVVCDFYEEPSLLLPMRVACTALIFLGIISPRIHALEKELSYLKLVALRQGAGMVGVIMAIVLSFYFRNIWPLVIGYVFEFSGMCALSYLFIPFKPTLKIDRECLRELMKFARGMLGLPILASVFFQYDIVVITRVFSMDSVGLYSVARFFALMPVVVFTKTICPLVLPTFSKLQHEAGKLHAALLKIGDLAAAAGGPFVAFCVIFSEPLLTLLYGGRYGTVYLSFALLMVYIFVRLLSTILMQLFLALARPDLQRSFSVVRVIVAGALVYPALKMFGMAGVALSVLLGAVSLLILQSIWAGRLIGLDMRHFYGRVLHGGSYSLLVIVPGALLRILYEGSDLLLVASGTGFCLAAWFAALRSSHYQGLVFGEQA